MNLPTVYKPKEVSTTSSEVVVEEASAVSIGDRIRIAQNMAIRCWQLVKQRSREYAAALDMNIQQIDELEHFNAIVVVHTTEGEIFLVPKNTCGCPYGDTWYHLLQARLPNGSPKGIGGGTTFIFALDVEIHDTVMKAIRQGQTEIRQCSIWP